MRYAYLTLDEVNEDWAERLAAQVDAELDASEAAESESAAPSGLWWENDPQLRERFRRG